MTEKQEGINIDKKEEFVVAEQENNVAQNSQEISEGDAHPIKSDCSKLSSVNLSSQDDSQTAEEKTTESSTTPKRKKFEWATFICYSATSVVILLIALWIVLARNFFEQETLSQKYVILCDAFTVPGIIAFGFGILIKISGTGFFTAMKYIGLSVLGAFIPGLKLRQKRYKDFKEAEDKKRKVLKTDFLLICGTFAMVIAVVFLILYQSA